MKTDSKLNNTLSISTAIVWDKVVRITHWLFVILLPLLYWTAEEGMMEIHQYLGIAILALVIFRIIWGFCGSQSGRFSTFVVSPNRVLRYSLSFFKRHSSEVFLTHNPMGGYMVVVMLGLLGTQATLGLFGTDDIFFEGYLAFLISYDLSVQLTGWHHWLFNIILVAIGLHIGAILWYQIYKRQPLIQAMLHGKKPKSHQN